MLLHRSSYWVLLAYSALFCIIWHNPSKSVISQRGFSIGQLEDTPLYAVVTPVRGNN